MENQRSPKKQDQLTEKQQPSLKEFLKCFYSENETVFLRLWCEQNKQGSSPKEFYPLLNRISEIIPELQRLNQQNYGVFFIPNGARRDEEVSRIAAQYFENDELSFEEQMKRIATFSLLPSIVVKTRKSYHVYYLLKDGKPELFRDIQRRLAAHFGGDRNIINPSRCMRLPFFNHCKREPVRVELTEFHPERVYTQEQLADALPEVQRDNPAEKHEWNRRTKEELEYIIENCTFLKHCKEHASILSETDWYNMICNLSVFEGGQDKVHDLSKGYPRYDYEETNRKIEHFLKSGAGPTTCRAIAEKGFVCPHLNTCSCKSPAAMKAITTPKWYEASGKSGLRLMPGVLADHLTKAVPAIYTAERFYLYQDGVYREATDLEIQKIIHRHLIVTKMRSSDITDVMALWKVNISKKVEEVNTDPYVINLRNGLYDIRTKQLLTHSPDYLSTIRIETSYRPEADCPKFKQFLNESIESELIPIIQEIFGYAMTMLVDAQMAFILKGVARSGKSTLIRVLEDIVGKDNVSNIPLQSLGDRFSTAELYGTLLNCYSDLPSKAVEGDGIFKAIVGSDSIMAERKNKNPFTFRPFVKLIFSTNELPAQVDRSEGFFRRLKIIRFERQVPESQINTRLADELNAEANGIFLWAMQGLDRLRANNFRFSQAVSAEEELDKYRVLSNNALSFVQDECIFEPGCSVHSKELFEHYQEYCKRNGFHLMAINKFSGEMERNFSGKIRKYREAKTRKNTWEGIRMAEFPTVEQEQLVEDAIRLANHANTRRTPYQD